MVTKTKPEANGVTVPTDWHDGTDAVVLEGVSLVDKASLKGKPFLITGIRNHVGNQDVLYAQIEFTHGTYADGERLMFQDSGKGIRDQVGAFLTTLGKVDVLEEWVDCKVICPQGLRVSPHVQKDDRGRDVNVESWYLTTSGRRNR